jgi:hypothetical protein
MSRTIHIESLLNYTVQNSSLQMPYNEKINPQLNAERRKRQHATECIEQLKDLIPVNSHMPGLPQATILENTVQYIRQVTQLLQELERTETDDQEKCKIRQLLASLENQ